MKECQLFFEYGEWNGGSYTQKEDGGLSLVSPKAFIEYDYTRGYQFGYVEDIENQAQVRIPHLGTKHLDIPSELNRPYPWQQSEANGKMVIVEIRPVRVKFSKRTMKMTVIFDKFSVHANGDVILHEST